MGKIDRLNREIEKLDRKIEIADEKIIMAKEKHHNKQITKAKYNKIKMKQQTKIRNFRNAIKRKKKARMDLEKKMHEEEQERLKELEDNR